MALTGLTLPRFSAPDPDVFGEGSLDPLGLAAIADGLVDQYAPGITARMTRIRLITAIAVVAAACEPLGDVTSPDGVTPPWLAAEWVIVEAMVQGLSPDDTRGLPGTAKARAARDRGSHLDARSYLKTPKVFGFHGVFKRLAVALDVVDDDLVLTARGVELLRAWEREQDLDGFTEQRTGTAGATFRRQLMVTTQRSVTDGIACALHREPADRIRRTLHVAGAGPAERAALWSWLSDRGEPLRREVVLGLRRVGRGDLREQDALQELRSQASPELLLRLNAVHAYETFASRLTRALDAIRVESSRFHQQAFTIGDAVALAPVDDAARSISSDFARAAEAMELVGRATALHTTLNGFGSRTPPHEFVENLLVHHEGVQRNKSSAGKRPWFERVPGGISMRLPYRIDKMAYEPGDYVHPLRVRAIRGFIEDLQR